MRSTTSAGASRKATAARHRSACNRSLFGARKRPHARRRLQQRQDHVRFRTGGGQPAGKSRDDENRHLRAGVRDCRWQRADQRECVFARYGEVVGQRRPDGFRPLRRYAHRAVRSQRRESAARWQTTATVASTPPLASRCAGPGNDPLRELRRIGARSLASGAGMRQRGCAMQPAQRIPCRSAARAGRGEERRDRLAQRGQRRLALARRRFLHPQSQRHPVSDHRGTSGQCRLLRQRRRYLAHRYRAERVATSAASSAGSSSTATSRLRSTMLSSSTARITRSSRPSRIRLRSPARTSSW